MASPEFELGESDRQAQYEPLARVLDADSYLRSAITLATKELSLGPQTVKEWYEQVLLDEMSIDGFFDSIIRLAGHDVDQKALGALWVLRRGAGGGRF